MLDGNEQLAAAATIARLAAMSAVEYDQCRIAEAEALHIRVSTLDDEVQAARPGNGAAGPQHGRTVHLPEPEPWPEPVALAWVLRELAAATRRHIIFSDEAAAVVALWAAHTWVFERFLHSPRLAITSPTKRCGKSTLLAILALICRRPLKADNISASGVFRVVEALTPLTLLLDEVDAFAVENEELRGVLNSGFEASGAVIRVVERDGQHEPVQFATFAPLVLAAIGTIPGTLSDRAVPLRMERKAMSDTVTRLRDPGAADEMRSLGRKLARWAADDGGRLAPCPPIPGAMNDREGDISLPLLAIADAAGGEWPGRARRALLHLFGLRSGADEGTEHGVLLLTDIKAIFAETGAERLPSAAICEKLAEMDERPWPEWKAGKPMTQVQLARALAPFRVLPQTIRLEGVNKTPKGYYRDHFADAWRRYTPAPPKGEDLNRNTATSGGFAGVEGETQAATPESCGASERPRNPRDSAGCGGVADQNPHPEGEGGSHSPLNGAAPNRNTATGPGFAGVGHTNGTATPNPSGGVTDQNPPSGTDDEVIL